MFTLSLIALLSALAAVFASPGQEIFIKGPCRPNPCRNRGRCSLVELDKEIVVPSCKCKPKVAGVNCRILCRPKAWLNKTCDSDEDCKVTLRKKLARANADRQPKCFQKRCLCPLGMYYSVGQRFCVKYCHPDDRQPTFSVYPTTGIDGHNDFVWYTENNDLEKCKQACLKEPTCKNFETDGSKCNGATVNLIPGEIIFSTEDSGWSHYQIDCA